MISFETALLKVLEFTEDYGSELVELQSSQGRTLAETIIADRDFPPFDRSTKDGIAIKYNSDIGSDTSFKIAGIAQAGSPQLTLEDESTCIEIMTGAMVPKNADAVVMYEHTRKENDGFSITEPIKKGQNIHYKGSDTAMEDKLLLRGTTITSAEIGVLATVGKFEVLVKKLPKVAVISTGNELVDVGQQPLPYQIRKSNSHTLIALLQSEHLEANMYHLVDEPIVLKKKLDELLNRYDVLLLSGGVSKGKFDFLPSTFDALGVDKVFHKVMQRPGKPFWFGKHQSQKTIIFSFPGNPVSTFVNYHTYFLPWLNKTLGVPTSQFTVFLKEPMENKTDLTLFIGVEIGLDDGKLMARKISSTGSGDLLSLSKAGGFVKLNPRESLGANKLISFIPARRIL
ncbi:molybdopterin molybdotransferase MoeA [Flagellimonas pacifica]|uniref:Molybdopterin molybdenumtransferase n=1 Tax=Flagellimonas pacifica TaxID=1247520 RepID=A0A285MS12_9FLAO|nr:molybdopterin molybdotransferase MoeA [Allomuricauda parva]SNY99908.1 molybdopterin molybdochelatase [Allomuricauda parva]